MENIVLDDLGDYISNGAIEFQNVYIKFDEYFYDGSDFVMARHKNDGEYCYDLDEVARIVDLHPQTDFYIDPVSRSFVKIFIHNHDIKLVIKNKGNLELH